MFLHRVVCAVGIVSSANTPPKRRRPSKRHRPRGRAPRDGSAGAVGGEHRAEVRQLSPAVLGRRRGGKCAQRPVTVNRQRVSRKLVKVGVLRQQGTEVPITATVNRRRLGHAGVRATAAVPARATKNPAPSHTT